MGTFVTNYSIYNTKMQSWAGFEALFKYATEGIVVIAEKGDIVLVNPSAEKLFGYDKDELIGKRIEVLVPSRLKGAHEGHREKYNTNPHARAMGRENELFGMRKDKTEFPVEVSLSPYSTDSGKFVIGFIIDITIRKQAEERQKNYTAELEKHVKNRTLILEEAIQELEKTKIELKEALDKEKELNELKSRFVSMASHEFRTPLATIMSSLSLVKHYSANDDQEKQDKHINRIKSSINNMTGLLNDFLSVSKLEEGKVVNTAEEFNLHTFIADVVIDMESLVKNGQHIVHTHSGDEIAFMDKKHLQNVLFNLISNAIKFSPNDAHITICSEKTEVAVIISVKDNGIGISEDDQKHLFERFYRGHNATYIQGTGLGLHIVAKYVELMNGTIEFESEEDKGTIFTMHFPQNI